MPYDVLCFLFSVNSSLFKIRFYPTTNTRLQIFRKYSLWRSLNLKLIIFITGLAKQSKMKKPERAGKSAVREACAETLTAEIGWKEAEFATIFRFSAAIDDAGSLRKPSLGGLRVESPPRPGREQKTDGLDALIANPSIESDGTERVCSFMWF